ncbi:MAG: ABC transporter ATP-binding protein [Eubacterium sp.]|nr:ABC transporter ATP-binding protein [Eubacterium sp.]
MLAAAIRDVSLTFRMEQNRADSLKEFCVRWLRRDLGAEEFFALRQISLEAEQGDVVGIIGHNGAGKSTLLKVIAGIMKPTQGSVEVHGSVVPMLELGSGFDPELSGRENVYLNGAVLGYSKKFLDSKYHEILDFSELGGFIEAPLRTYSSGMLARLAFSVACMVEPDILIVDEILSVGDADFQEKSYARMMELMTGGTTVFFVSHSLKQIRQMCSRVVWLEHGRMQAQGDTQTVCNMYEGKAGK